MRESEGEDVGSEESAEEQASQMEEVAVEILDAIKIERAIEMDPSSWPDLG